MFVEVDEFVRHMRENFDEEKMKIFLEYIVLCVMGACVWTNNSNVREAKKGKEQKKRD